MKLLAALIACSLTVAASAADFSSEAGVTAFLTEMKPNKKLSAAEFKLGSEALVASSKNNWVKSKADVLAWLKKSFSKPPADFPVAADTAKQSYEALYAAEPRDWPALYSYAQILNTWLTPISIKKLPMENITPVIVVVSRAFHESGHTQQASELFSRLPNSYMKANPGIAALAMEPACANWRMRAQIKKCSAAVEKIQKFADELKDPQPMLAVERARILFDTGKIDEARTAYMAVIEQRKAVKNDSFLPWLYLEVGFLELAAGKAEAADAMATEVWNTLQAQNPGGVNALLKSPFLTLKARVLMEQGKFTEAKAMLAEMEQSTQDKFRGSNPHMIAAELYGMIIAGAERDQKVVNERRQNLKKLTRQFPSWQLMNPFADAVAKTATKGKFVETDLAPLKAIIGQKSANIDGFRNMLKLVARGQDTPVPKAQ